MTKAQSQFGDWTFLKSDSNLGKWKPKGGSPNTLEEYTITPSGSWVPTVDVEWLLGFRWTCPCGGNRRVLMFSRASPDRRQMMNKPNRPPQMRGDEKSNFGLVRVK